MSATSSDSATNGTPESLLAEVREHLCQLEAALPKSVDGYGLSPKSKLPFKVLWYREALLWRTVRLGECALARCLGIRPGTICMVTKKTRAGSKELQRCPSCGYKRAEVLLIDTALSGAAREQRFCHSCKPVGLPANHHRVLSEPAE